LLDVGRRVGVDVARIPQIAHERNGFLVFGCLPVAGELAATLAPLIWRTKHAEHPLHILRLNSTDPVHATSGGLFDRVDEVVFVADSGDASLVERVLLDEHGRAYGVHHARQRVDLAVVYAVSPRRLWQVGKIWESFDRVTADERCQVGALALE